MKDTQTVQHLDVQSGRFELCQIVERTDMMQFRGGLQEHHVRDLVERLKQGRELDPVTLWEDPETGALVLADGHHRVAAYREVKWLKPIKADIHRCSEDEARLLGLTENGKARLPLTKQEAADAAWRLVCIGPAGPKWTYSKPRINEVTGISNGQLGTMRGVRVKIELATMDLPASWSAARMSIHGDDNDGFTEEQWDTWDAEKARMIEDEIGDRLGFYAARYPRSLQAVLFRRCTQECRSLLYEELLGEFDPARAEGEADY